MRTVSRPEIIGAIWPPPYTQSSPPKPDVEGAQSPPAAHRDDFLATNSSAGLVAEDHPPKRRRGGWGRAGVFAVAAWLAWLACPTVAFAQGIGVYSIAINDEVDALEKWNGFTITGGTGTDSGVIVTVYVNGTQVGTVTSAKVGNATNATWSVLVDGDATGDSFVTTDTSGQKAKATRGTFGNLDYVFHERDFSVDLALPLEVDDVTGDNIVNNGTFNITGNTSPFGTAVISLKLGNNLILTTTSESSDATWLSNVKEEDTNYSDGDSVSLKVTATKEGYTISDEVELTLTVDLVNPTVIYNTAPSSLQVRVAIDALSPDYNNSSDDIVSYLASSLPLGLTINQDTGVISGAPTTVNDSKQTSKVTVKDQGNNIGELEIEFPVVVAGTLTVALNAITGDDYLNASEFSGGGFNITGDTGETGGASVTVTITGVDPGGNATPLGTLTANSNASGDWSVDVPENADYIVANAVLTVSATAAKTNYTAAPSVSRTLTVDLTAPTASYTAPQSLTVGVAITAIDPTTNDTDIDSYAISSGSLPRGLLLNGKTGVISGAPTTGNSNTETVEVLATDDAGNTGTAMIDFPPVGGPKPGVTTSRTDPSMPLSVPEGGSAEYMLVLDTEPTHDVTITVRSPVGDDDLTAVPDMLTFTPGNWHAERTVTVSAAEDDDGVAGIRNFIHTVVSTDSIYDGISAPGVKAIEADNDQIGVTVWPQVLRIPEGGSREYKVVLNTPPTQEVKITVTRDQGGDTDLTATPDELVFSVSNWSEAQEVTVSAMPDADQGDGVAIFAHNAASNDDDYYDIPIASVRVTEDENRPRVEMQTKASAPVGGAFEVAFLFSEPVEGFELEDIQVTNGTASNFVKISPQEYTVTITPEGIGEVRVEVPEDVAADGVGNGNRAAEPLVIEADLERPEVTIEGPTEPVGIAAFEVTIAFSESVEGFELEDIRVTNGTASNFTKVSPQEYTATIMPEGIGEVRVEVPEDVAEDVAGNGNRAAEPLVIEADLERPEVTIEGPTEPVGIAAFEVTIAFSEPVEGFELEDIRVTNGTASNFTKVSPQEYTATIMPEGIGEVRVEVPEDVAEDVAGSGNRAAEPLVIEADLERPEVTIEGPTEPVGIAAFEVTIAFSEPVKGFELEDIQVTNGTASNFVKISPQEYTVTITPEGIGEVRVEVPEDVAEDVAGNGNRAAKAFEVETKRVVSYQEERYTAREGGETVAVTVKLSQGWDEELAIPIRVTRPEATEVADYTLDDLEEWDAQEGTGRLTFPAEETEQTFTITANHDGDGDDETVALGFGELPEIVLAGEPAVATVTLEDKGLVELEVRFGQAAYEVKEGEVAEIKVTVSPTADRQVDVPLVVALQAGTTLEDYSGVPASVVFEEGESERTISVEVLADDVSDSGEGMVLSLGALPEGVSTGEPSSTEVHFRQQRTAEQFTPSLEAMLAVMARSMGESAQTAIEGRFARHRQWSRLGAAGATVPTAPPGSDHSAAALSPGESQRIGSESLEGAGRKRAEGSLVEHAWGAAQTSAATGSEWNSEHRETGTPVSWLRNVVLGSFGNLARAAQSASAMSTGYGMAPGGRVFGQDRRYGSGFGDARLGPSSGDFTGMRDHAPLPGAGTRDTGAAGYSAMLGQALNLSGTSFEMPLGKQEQEKETSRSWVPVLWGQGDLQHFNGNLTRYEMSYRGGLEAAHVGLDLYANDKVLAGLSFMRSWGNMEYSDDGIDGTLGSRMNTVHPYLYWQPAERVSVWGMGGLGRGRVDVNEPGRRHNFEADFRMFSGGVRTVLSRRGSNEVGLRADTFTAQLGTEASEDIAKVRGEAHRARLMLEWVHTMQLSAGRSLSLQAEAGGRFDGGDAERGSGAETGFRLGYLDANSGLDVAMLGRVLVAHESDYRDWGLGVQASWDPGEKQRGFRASVTSARGQDGGGRTTLWNNANMVTRPVGMDAMGMSSQSRIESEVAYGGLRVLGVPGLLTPYSRLRWAGQSRELAWGTAWSLPPRSQQGLPLILEWEAMGRENSMGPAGLAVLVRMSIPF